MTTHREFIPRLTRVLEEAGIGDARLIRRGKHPALQFTYEGSCVMYVFPGTSGDVRAVHNCCANLRRLLRQGTFKRAH